MPHVMALAGVLTPEHAASMRKWSGVRRIYPARISTEVVEHLYAPREWAKGAFRALKPGGRGIRTTSQVAAR